MYSDSFRFTVSEAQTRQPLVDLVAAHIGREYAQQAFARGGVWVGRRRVRSTDFVLLPGSQVVVHMPPTGEYSDIDFTQDDICYEDEWLLAVNKQAGWYSTATPWDADGHVQMALTHFLRTRDNTPTPYTHLAHQLDRDTSGILLFAKDPRVNAPLQAVFSSDAMVKRYACVCAGLPEQTVFEVRSGHGRGRAGRWRLYNPDEIGKTLPDGKPVRFAHTRFVVEQTLTGAEQAALLQATLLTGRTHQIRLHLASLGHPILGDTRYGGPATFQNQPLTTHFLHAASVEMEHPITRERLTLHAALPAHIRAIFDFAGTS